MVDWVYARGRRALPVLRLPRRSIYLTPEVEEFIGAARTGVVADWVGDTGAAELGLDPDERDWLEAYLRNLAAHRETMGWE